MAAQVKPIADGYHVVTPYLCLKDAAVAIDWYKNALGAEEVSRMPGPGGQGVMHAEITIGDSRIMLSDECPGMDAKAPTSLGGTTGSLHVYVNDVDKAFERVVAAGAKAIMPPMNMFWGDRFGKFTDPFGHSWSLATHIEDVPPEEMLARGEAWMKQMGTQK